MASKYTMKIWDRNKCSVNEHLNRTQHKISKIRPPSRPMASSTSMVPICCRGARPLTAGRALRTWLLTQPSQPAECVATRPFCSALAAGCVPAAASIRAHGQTWMARFRLSAGSKQTTCFFSLLFSPLHRIQFDCSLL